MRSAATVKRCRELQHHHDQEVEGTKGTTARSSSKSCTTPPPLSSLRPVSPQGPLLVASSPAPTLPPLKNEATINATTSSTIRSASPSSSKNFKGLSPEALERTSITRLSSATTTVGNSATQIQQHQTHLSSGGQPLSLLDDTAFRDRDRSPGTSSVRSRSSTTSSSTLSARRNRDNGAVSQDTANTGEKSKRARKNSTTKKKHKEGSSTGTTPRRGPSPSSTSGGATPSLSKSPGPLAPLATRKPPPPQLSLYSEEKLSSIGSYDTSQGGITNNTSSTEHIGDGANGAAGTSQEEKDTSGPYSPLIEVTASSPPRGGRYQNKSENPTNKSNRNSKSSNPLEMSIEAQSVRSEDGGNSSSVRSSTGMLERGHSGSSLQMNHNAASGTSVASSSSDEFPLPQRTSSSSPPLGAFQPVRLADMKQVQSSGGGSDTSLTVVNSFSCSDPNLGSQVPSTSASGVNLLSKIRGRFHHSLRNRAPIPKPKVPEPCASRSSDRTDIRQQKQNKKGGVGERDDEQTADSSLEMVDQRVAARDRGRESVAKWVKLQEEETLEQRLQKHSLESARSCLFSLLSEARWFQRKQQQEWQQQQQESERREVKSPPLTLVPLKSVLGSLSRERKQAAFTTDLIGQEISLSDLNCLTTGVSSSGSGGASGSSSVTIHEDEEHRFMTATENKSKKGGDKDKGGQPVEEVSLISAEGMSFHWVDLTSDKNFSTINQWLLSAEDFNQLTSRRALILRLRLFRFPSQ